jgi:putative acetyltransferase
MDFRLEQPADVAAVLALHHAAFGAHGGVVCRLIDALRPIEGLALVATDAEAVVGHGMFTRSLLDAPPRLVEVEVLSPLAVLPERQGQGIGSALVRRGLELLAERGAPLVFLEGPPSYYSRLGFGPATEQGFRKPSLRIPDGAFQVARLPAYEPWMTGTLVYSDPFWACDVVGLRDDTAADR